MKTPAPGSREGPTAGESALQRKLFVIIFESDTPAGKAFDLGLLVAICASVAVVMLESVHDIAATHGSSLRILEWSFTILFAIEYLTRLYCVRRPLAYAWSFFGVVDLIAVLPSFISLFTTANYVMVVRVLRLLRVFRILKLAHFLQETEMLTRALRASRRKIFVFLFTIVTLVTIMGTAMYLIEGEAHGFDSIPQGVYWAIVTLTTVGYGDIAPQTAIGRFLASIIMVMGYGIIAVPTGIFSMELRQAAKEREARVCGKCATTETDTAANFCRRCGEPLATSAASART